MRSCKIAFHRRMAINKNYGKQNYTKTSYNRQKPYTVSSNKKFLEKGKNPQQGHRRYHRK